MIDIRNLPDTSSIQQMILARKAEIGELKELLRLARLRDARKKAVVISRSSGTRVQEAPPTTADKRTVPRHEEKRL